MVGMIFGGSGVGVCGCFGLFVVFGGVVKLLKRWFLVVIFGLFGVLFVCWCGVNWFWFVVVRFDGMERLLGCLINVIRILFGWLLIFRDNWLEVISLIELIGKFVRVIVSGVVCGLFLFVGVG